MCLDITTIKFTLFAKDENSRLEVVSGGGRDAISKLSTHHKHVLLISILNLQLKLNQLHPSCSRPLLTAKLSGMNTSMEQVN